MSTSTCPFSCLNVFNECSETGGKAGIGANIIGEIKLLPFASDELPNGWYFCNGDRYANTAAQGIALLALSTKYKTQWNITEVDGAVNVPNLFSDDGRGMFLRAVDGTTRQVGSVESDAIRNIEGEYSWYRQNDALTWSGSYLTGVFKQGKFKIPSRLTPGRTNDSTARALAFDASLAVPTAADNHPLNIGMTPAIYLGV